MQFQARQDSLAGLFISINSLTIPIVSLISFDFLMRMGYAVATGENG